MENSKNNPLFVFLSAALEIKKGNIKFPKITSRAGGKFETWIVNSIDKYKQWHEINATFVNPQNITEAAGGGKFPDIYVEKNDDIHYYECKAESGATELQFNSTPPARIAKDKNGKEHPCFYAICNYDKKSLIISSFCIAEGFYFNANDNLMADIKNFVKDNISKGLEKLENKDWKLQERPARGQDFGIYIENIGDFKNNDVKGRARIRRMYHWTNPIKIFDSQCFIILQEKYFINLGLKIEDIISFDVDGEKIDLKKIKEIIKEDMSGTKTKFLVYSLIS